MKATFKVLDHRIPAGKKRDSSVLRLQELLARWQRASTFEVSGIWSAGTEQSWRAFQQAKGGSESLIAGYADPIEHSELIRKLCEAAGVLITIPCNTHGAEAFECFYQASREVPYAWGQLGGADRVAYGLHGFPGNIIFTNTKNHFGVFEEAIAMNCISFANLALSIWRTGGADMSPYDPSQAAGGFDPVGHRFKLPFLKNPNVAKVSPLQCVAPPADRGVDLTTYFYSAEDVTAAASNGHLYYLQWCYLKDQTPNKNGVALPSGFGHHDTVLLNGFVYEINLKNRRHSRCVRRTALKDRLAESPGNAVRVMGPV